MNNIHSSSSKKVSVTKMSDEENYEMEEKSLNRSIDGWRERERRGMKE